MLLSMVPLLRRAFPAMPLACAMAFGATQVLAANPAPSVATDSRVKTFVFNENDVYNLLTYYGFQSNVEFGPKEKIETVSIGDRAGWQVVPAGRRLFIRAVADNLHTNMTVVTNEHAYQFDLRATNPAALPQEELAYVIRFYYPEDPRNARTPNALVPAAAPMAPSAPVAYPTGAAASAPMPSVEPAMPGGMTPVSAAPLPPMPAAMRTAPMNAAPMNTGPMNAGTDNTAAGIQNRYGAGPFDTPMSAGSSNAGPSNPNPSNAGPAPGPAAGPLPASANAQSLNFNYTYEGNGQMLPYALFDDGQRTYFQFLNAPKPPKLFRVNRAGKEVAVPLKREGNYFVAGGVGSKFVLRGAGKTGSDQPVTIYNEARPSK